MKTLILAGGKGTRFMEESKHMPKPMIPINGKPMIFHIINQYEKFNFNDFVILGGTKVDYIVNYFDNNFKKIDSTKYLYQTNENTKIQILDTGEETMTGGRVKKALEKLNVDEFLLTYGDGFCDVDINLVIKKFRETKTIATVTAVRPPARFGSLEIEGDFIKSFGEKNQAKEGWINGGFFVMNSKIVDFISSDSMPLEKEPLELLTKNNQLSVYQHFGFFQPVDTLREKELLEKYLIENDGY
jgi:glucose-1-phosphate cytidylyltransferase